jgi:hypothetical protein
VSEVLQALTPVVEALEDAGVRYRVGGSVASSALGVPRSTLDVDVACELRRECVDAFVARLAPAYYIDAAMIIDAIDRKASFNVVHLATMLKVDVFVKRLRRFDQVAFERFVVKPIDEGGRSFDFTSAEDIILHKLEWYRLGGEISERQWNDIMGVLAVQGDAIDRAYLRQWAAELCVGELLERALAALD